jgi:hypothetical protein
MKKSKKILSLLLAATMISGLSAAPAFAEDTPLSGEQLGTYENDGKAITSLPFMKILETKDKNASITDTTFSFTMAVDSNASGKDSKDNEIKPGIQFTVGDEKKDSITTTYETKHTDTVGEHTFSNGQRLVTVTGVASDSLAFDLTTLKFASTDNGVYQYTVSEDQPEKTNAAITYSEKTYIVDLYVVNGKIIYVQAKDNDQKAPIVFENVLTSSSLTIHKTIDGGMADETDEFKFEIYIPEKGENIDLNEALKLSVKKYDANGTETTAPEITPDDTDWTEFTLKGGEELVISNIPVGMVYKVKESDSKGYTAYMKRTIEGDVLADEDLTDSSKYGTANAVTMINNALTTDGGDHVYFLNIHDTPDTGITLDVLPYAVVVLLAAGCALLLISKKRRNAR